MSQGSIPEHGPKSFRMFIGAQFLGAFNDNLYKQLILFLALVMFPKEDKQGIAFAVFALPFVLFSGMAGDLSEKFSKRSIIFKMKILEIFIMALGLVAFQIQNWYMMLIVLFIMGLQSAFFGPSKYGVVPELVAPRGLLSANGSIAMTTFMGVLFGQALAGPLNDTFMKSGQMWIPGAACILLAIIGSGFAAGIGELKRHKPGLTISPSPFGRLFKTMEILSKEKGLMAIVVLNSFFWFNGGVIQQSIGALKGKHLLNIADDNLKYISFLLVTLAVSIMIGSVIAPFFCKKLSPGKITGVGVVGMILGQGLLLLVGPVIGPEQGYYFAHFCMVIIGFNGALFVVPIQAFLQNGPPEGMRGQTFAVNNFMNFLFIFLGGIFYIITRQMLGLSPTIVQAAAGLFIFIAFIFSFKHVKNMVIED